MAVTRENVVQITSGTIVRVFLFAALAAVLWFLRDIVLVVLTAVVIASAMEPGVRFFTTRGLNRVLAVVLLYLGVAVFFFGILFFFIPPVLDDAASFLTRLPATLATLNISDLSGGLLPWGSVTDTISSAELLRSIS